MAVIKKLKRGARLAKKAIKKRIKRTAPKLGRAGKALIRAAKKSARVTGNGAALLATAVGKPNAAQMRIRRRKKK